MRPNIKAESVGDLLRQIAGLNLGVPISLVMDPARDQKCKIVRQPASVLAIELLYLPTYCPNLNRIEGFWKFLNKKCLYSKYNSEFSAFKNAITNLLESDPHQLQTRTRLLTSTPFSDL